MTCRSGSDGIISSHFQYERLKSKGLLLVCHQRNCGAESLTSSEKQQLHKFAIGKRSAMLEFIFSWRINGWTGPRQVGDHDISRTSGFNFYECAFVTLAPPNVRLASSVMGLMIRLPAP